MAGFARRSLASSAFLLLVAAQSQAGGLKGRITFGGVAPKPRTVRMDLDPVCQAAHPRGVAFQSVQVGAKGGLADVFVYLDGPSMAQDKSLPSPKGPLVLEQKGCWYSPRVSGVMMGQPVRILNLDATMHNVNAHDEFNKGMPAGVHEIDESFHKPQAMLQVQCNVHPWMIAYVGVLNHPFFAVTDKNGAFEIKNAPPGKHVLHAWHETLGALEREITVGAKEKTVNIKYKAQQDKTQ